MRPVLLLALLAAAVACVQAADPSIAAGSTGTISAAAVTTSASSSASAKPTPQESAKAAAAAAMARTGSVQWSAYPAPHYLNYTFASSRDTFEICKNQSGLKREISFEELLPIYGLPKELLRHRRVSIEVLSRVFSAVAPSARLVIAPLLAGEAELSPVLHPDGKLPHLVHFTVRDKDAMLPHQAVAIATWARLNPGYSILLYDDQDIADFMATYHAHLLPLFNSLKSPVERTDLWRYLVLCTFGGVYADSDVVAGRPVSTWAQDAGLLTGVENVFATLEDARRRDYTRQMQVVQWIMAARAGHPVVCRMGEYVQRHMAREAAGEVNEEDRDHAILERTGPGIWSSSVHDYLREHGVVPESLVGGGKVGDLRLLPQSTFGCASSTVNLADPMAYVYHMFKGSWRLHDPEKLWQFITHLYEHLFEGVGHGAAAVAVAAVGSSPRVGSGGIRGSPAAVKGASAAAAAGDGAQQQQQEQQQEGRAGGGSGVLSSGAEVQLATERRLHEQLSDPSAIMQLRPLHADDAAVHDASLVHPRAPAAPLLPLASLLVVGGLVCSALVQRGSAKCSSGSSGRPCGALRQSASGAWVGILGGASRLARGLRRSTNAGPGCCGSAGSLLPLSLQPACKGVGAERPPLPSSSGSGSSSVVVAAACTSTRQQGASTGGCLKRSGGSMQSLLNGTGMQ